jgi:deoxyadenosine/deoxycytidine kinase
MNKWQPDYIVVEGPIGVGKTTLAKKLADTFNTELILESTSDNPFLPRFYENPESTALPTQLFFLFQRAKQIESLRQADMFRPVQIADFLIEKDRLFAKVTLTNEEFDLYQQVYDHMTLEVPVPDLVIYLQSPVNILLKRIIERGIDYEKQIDESYLKNIANAYIDFFYNYTASPLLIVNTHDFNLVDGTHNYNMLLDHINQLPPGRHYFNPKGL